MTVTIETAVQNNGNGSTVGDNVGLPRSSQHNNTGFLHALFRPHKLVRWPMFINARKRKRYFVRTILLVKFAREWRQAKVHSHCLVAFGRGVEKNRNVGRDVLARVHEKVGCRKGQAFNPLDLFPKYMPYSRDMTILISGNWSNLACTPTNAEPSSLSILDDSLVISMSVKLDCHLPVGHVSLDDTNLFLSSCFFFCSL